MRNFILIVSLCLVGCMSTPKSFDIGYERSEVADLAGAHFETSSDLLKKALKPSFEKYGKPDLFIAGQMSSVDAPDISRLYGFGDVKTKLNLPSETFWQIDGDVLGGHFSPLKSVHMVYDMTTLDSLRETLPRIGSLNTRGKSFTVFERETDGLIVVSVHRTEALPKEATFQNIRFFDY